MNIDGASILVTGGCGLIGSTTIDLLLRDHAPERVDETTLATRGDQTEDTAPLTTAGAVMNTIEVSLVMCTRNRALFLPLALGYCARIASARRWELVIVDNGSTDATASVIAEFRRESGISLRTVFEPMPGLGRARNAGWRNAAGSIVAFTDDDCYPSSDYIDQVCLCMEQRGLDYVGGRVLLHDPGDLPFTIQLRKTVYDVPPHTFLKTGLIIGANMAVRRSVLEQLGGFDELLGAGTPFPSEDAEFLSRASARGFVGGYDPRPVIAHHHRRRTQAELDKLTRSYEVGRGGYYMACLMDPLRRGQAMRHWYWTKREEFLHLWHKPSAFMTAAREVRGAIGYWRAARARLVATAPSQSTNNGIAPP
jgi:glycosyltransferase involved in cell wall biosynthesis